MERAVTDTTASVQCVSAAGSGTWQPKMARSRGAQGIIAAFCIILGLIGSNPEGAREVASDLAPKRRNRTATEETDSFDMVDVEIGDFEDCQVQTDSE